ncbi:MAG: methyltransferase domain-containing protein [Planctomycetaceae bacterium]|nr:methyltransferase domain-containing protein [Planctomycetaceae bacterium]MBV8608150.1 methyltransferase domain-containing protein [Singulisphaera sp.]
MTARHEAEVGSRFDRLHRRFKREVAGDDVRLRALRACLEPLRGRRVLDLGCGKGRFAARLAESGADVVGIDLSAAMLAEAEGLALVRGSARRLPFASASFDAVVAVEVFEHLADVDAALREARRVLRPGGVLAIVDKNACSMSAQRPWLPNLVVKWIDEKRGRWMYPSGGPVHERWFRPAWLRDRLRRDFEDVWVEHLLMPSEVGCWLFRYAACARLMVLWSARVPGGRLA